MSYWFGAGKPRWKQPIEGTGQLITYELPMPGQCGDAPVDLMSGVLADSKSSDGDEQGTICPSK